MLSLQGTYEKDGVCLKCPFGTYSISTVTDPPISEAACNQKYCPKGFGELSQLFSKLQPLLSDMAAYSVETTAMATSACHLKFSACCNAMDHVYAQAQHLGRLIRWQPGTATQHIRLFTFPGVACSIHVLVCRDLLPLTPADTV